MMLDAASGVWTAVIAYADHHGSGLAAVAALVGVPVLLIQISQSGRQERRRIRARRLAALSTLPMTLTAIIVWAEAAVQSQTAIYIWAKRRGQGQVAPAYQPPPSPAHLIGDIERMIEAAPKDRIGKTLAAIVSEIQVVSSRLSAADEFTPDNISGQQFSIDENIVRAASIYSLAESLFRDARKLSDDVPLDYARMASALLLMNIHDGNYDDPHKMIARRAERLRLQRRRGYERLWDWIRSKRKDPAIEGEAMPQADIAAGGFIDTGFADREPH